MRKIATTALIALTLAGCGILPSTTSSTTANTTTKSSLMSILGLDEATESVATDSVDAEESEKMGPAQLLFVLLDTDGNGKVSLEEMSTVLAKYATIESSKLEELFDKMDRNGDGSLVLSEMQPERRIEHRKPPRKGHGRHGRDEMGDRRPPMDEEGEG